ncbi:MAG: cytochrome b/b6 domain-containing protein [Verrucomicrobiota bacterium]
MCRLWIGLILWLVAAAAGSAAPALRDSDCLDCHSDKTLSRTNAAGTEESLFVDPALLAASAHRTNSCVSCHTAITAKHPDDNLPVTPVQCASCHERASATYQSSVHGLAEKAGTPGVAGCKDCHGTHRVAGSDSPGSLLHSSMEARTCGECHAKEAQDWESSVHGAAARAGKREAPLCTDCHSEHNIEALKGSSPIKISEQVCSRCHASERLNTKFNLPGDRVKTFFESYHGLAAQYGSTVAANCGSCHGYHRVLPSSDPGSTIHPSHLIETCGKCHPGAGEKFVSDRIHVDTAAAQSGPELGSRINWWVRRLYLALIVGVIGTMGVHNILVFARKVRARFALSARPVLRMSASQRWQHLVLAGSFIVLALTGFALKFPDSFLAHAMGSSEPVRRWTHRGAGIVLLLAGVYHLAYILFRPEGRRLVRDLLPVRQDAVDVWIAARYLLGWSQEKPRFGRFGYAEKMEYWAVLWGTIIMGASGLMIWFKVDVTRWLPRWAVEVAWTVHYYEALLACLAIVVWHFYHVLFDPDVYPLNPACWDGRVSRHWQMEEHPLDPASAPAAPTAPTPDPQPGDKKHLIKN